MASLYQRNGLYYAQVYASKKRYQFSLGTRTVRVANRLLLRLEDRWAAGEAHPSQGLDGLEDRAPEVIPDLRRQVAAFLETRSLLKPKTVRAYETALGHLLRAGTPEAAIKPYDSVANFVG